MKLGCEHGRPSPSSCPHCMGIATKPSRAAVTVCKCGWQLPTNWVLQTQATVTGHEGLKFKLTGARVEFRCPTCATQLFVSFGEDPQQPRVQIEEVR